MNKNNSVDLLDGEKKEIKDLRERIESKLIMRGIADPKDALDCQIYQATVAVLKDIMLEYRTDFKKRKRAANAKKNLLLVYGVSRWQIFKKHFKESWLIRTVMFSF